MDSKEARTVANCLVADEVALQPFMNTSGDETFRFLGLPTLIRAAGEATSGTFGLVEHLEMPPGFATPYHTHHNEDEAFYVLDGEVAFICDGKWLKGAAGTFVFGPREIVHGFKVIGNRQARMLLLCSPAGFERFVLELSMPATAAPGPPDMQKLMETAAKFHIDIHGPLPEMPADLESDATAAYGVEDLKSLNRRWIEAFNAQDWKTERALRGANFKAYMSGNREPLDYEAWSGFMQSFTTAFPDARIDIEECVAEGEHVVTRWTLSGTHRGEFQGVPASGRAVRIPGIEFNRVADGRLVDHWSQFDLVALLGQIGAMPA